MDNNPTTILIADDHDSLRRGLAQAVAEAGHDVDEAPNGNAAIEKLHEGFYDVVPVPFVISDEKAHYHVPLLIAPFGYSTYRGS